MMRLANHSSEYDVAREVMAIMPIEPCRVPVEVIASDLRVKPIAVSHALSNIREAGFALSFGGAFGNSVSLGRESAQTAQETVERYIQAIYHE